MTKQEVARRFAVVLALVAALAALSLAPPTSADVWPSHGWSGLAKKAHRAQLALASASAVTFVGKTSGANAATSLSVADPGAGYEVAVVSVVTEDVTVNTPSGWTFEGMLTGADTPDNNTFRMYVYSAPNPSGSVSFTKSNTRAWQVARLAYSNVSDVVATLRASADGTRHTLPAATVPAGGLLLGAIVSDEAITGQAYAAPSGWTERHDSYPSSGAGLGIEEDFNDPQAPEYIDSAKSDWAVTASIALAPSSASANAAPTVSAGPDLTAQTNEVIVLQGSASDDGLPAGSSLSVLWSRVTAPGTVLFYDANMATSQASFGSPGTYVLRLTASDGSLSSSDDVTVVVSDASPPPPTNAAPVVSAGPDLSVTLPASANLDGAVSDDGLPSGSTVSSSWSKVSGPGTVTFGSASAVDTTASFSAAGTYVLRLTASDSALSSSDEVTVTVSDAATPPPPPPGDASTPLAPEAGFSRIMTDEFSGTALDTTKWSAYSGQLSSSDGCPRPENQIVANGVLTMLMAYDTSGYCGAHWYHGSMMVKAQYGANNQSVTLRFRIVANDPANTRSHHILPMRWNDAGPWYIGESDYCEGSSYTSCTAFLHHSSSTQQVASPDIVFDQTQWHTIRATQYPGNNVAIFVDDMATPRWFYDGTTTTVPDVVKRTVLQQECRSSCPTNTAGTERIEVDWLTIDNAS